MTTKNFIDYIQKYDSDIIFIAITNIILSKLLKENNLYLQFSDFLTNLIQNYFGIPEITKKLILLVTNKEFEKIKILIKKSIINENNKSNNEKKYHKYLTILLML